MDPLSNYPDEELKKIAAGDCDYEKLKLTNCPCRACRAQRYLNARRFSKLMDDVLKGSVDDAG